MVVMLERWQRSFDGRIGPLIEGAARRVSGVRVRLEAASLQATDIATVADLDRLPILSKDDLLDLQRQSPPFGGMLADDASPRRVFQSPGPLYEPETESGDSWHWTPALTAAGVDASDRVLVAFSYHLSPAGAMFEQACLSIGATVVPAGVGNRDLQVTACRDLDVTAYVGPPSYLKALHEAAEQAGTALGIRRALVTGEPLPDSLRDWLTERTPAVRQAYGTAECGLLGYECEAIDGFHVPEHTLVQVCDLTTSRPLNDGTQGQVVVTRFTTDYPVIRFGTGDLSSWLLDPCSCGQLGPRLAGWQGRVGDAVKVRGMFLHPTQLSHVLDPLAGIADWRVVITRSDHRDIVTCEVVPANGSPEDLVDQVRESIRQGLRFSADVVVVRSLPSDHRQFADERTWA